MKKRGGLFSCIILFISVMLIAAKLSVFTVPASPELINLSSETPFFQGKCIENNSVNVIDRDGDINLLVWNIYKQQKVGWDEALTSFSEQADILLLQEAKVTNDLHHFLNKNQLYSELVRAFDLFDDSMGVLNIAKVPPKRICGYVAQEPWLQLPKSASLSVYQLSDGQSLMVVNIHAINFTVGVDEYQQQIEVLKKEVAMHSGPLIVAGDFNSWSEQRMGVLNRVIAALNLTEVTFNPDERVRFINDLPLDHVFYRGLTIKKAQSIESAASDHNPLQVEFHISM